MNDTSPAKFDLERFLPYRLSVLTNTVSQGIARSYRDRFDLSITEWRILAVLGRFPGLTASEVTERTAMDKVSISRAVKRMLEKSLIQRRTDPQDRRRMQLFVTAKRGREVLGDVIPMAQRFERQLLAGLTQEESARFFHILEKLQQQVEAIESR